MIYRQIQHESALDIPPRILIWRLRGGQRLHPCAGGAMSEYDVGVEGGISTHAEIGSNIH